MPTRRENLLESLAKADLKADVNRLKKAEQYLGLAHTSLDGTFHSRKFKHDFDAEGMRGRIATDCEKLRQLIQKGK